MRVGIQDHRRNQVFNSFGNAFVDHFAAGREWEARQFDGTVTDWGIARYLESA